MLPRSYLAGALLLLLIAGSWLALRVVAAEPRAQPLGAQGSSPPRVDGASDLPRAPTTQAEAPAAGPEPDALLAQLASLTSPEGRARTERERMARDRDSYRELRARAKRSQIETSMMHAIEERSRYPAHNQRFLLARHDPVLKAREVERRDKASRDGSVLLTVYTDRKQYDLGQTVQLAATLTARPGHAAQLPDVLEGSLSSEDGRQLARFTLQAESPGSYTARLDGALLRQRLPGGLYLARVVAGEELAQVAAFTVRPAYARLTGQYRDALTAGALTVEAEAQVDEPGEYHVLATLYTEDGVPAGVTEHTYNLTQGTHWLALHYHGKLVHDAAPAGRYRLAHLLFTRVSFPVAEGVQADPDYWTRAYAEGELDPSPYNELTEELGE